MQYTKGMRIAVKLLCVKCCYIITGIRRVESERWHQQQTVEIDLKTEKLNSWMYNTYLLISLYVCTFNFYLNLWHMIS